MPKSKFIVVIVLLFVFLTNHSLVSNTATFSDKITEIRTEINKPSKAEEFYEKSFMTSDARSEELIVYLKTNVSKEVFKQAREQYPTLVGNHNQVLARHR